MVPIARKRERGRPKLTAAQRKERRERGDRLRAALNELGLSQAELARLSGVAQGRIAELVSGKRPLTLEHVEKLAKAGVSADYLLGAADMRPSGAIAEQRGLETELAAALARDVTRACPPDTRMAWVVNGAAAYQIVLEAVARYAERERTERHAMITQSGLVVDAMELAAFIASNPDNVALPIWGIASRFLKDAGKSLSEATATLGSGRPRPIDLVPVRPENPEKVAEVLRRFKQAEDQLRSDTEILSQRLHATEEKRDGQA